jgi:hypothetical protein
MGGGPDSVHPLMALLFCVKHLSNTKLTLLTILTLHTPCLGKKAFITALGYIGTTSLKISHPYGFPL